MSDMLKPFPWLAEGGYDAGATAAVRDAIQCTDTGNMNYEDSIYASCEEEKNYIKEKSQLVI